MTGVTIYSAPLPEGPEASHRLLRRAAALAAPQLTDCTLARQAQGKPWFPAAPELHFSISHSGGRWVCAFADAPVGLDLQGELAQIHRPRPFRPAGGDRPCAGRPVSRPPGRAAAAAAGLRQVFAVRVYTRTCTGHVDRIIKAFLAEGFSSA